MALFQLVGRMFISGGMTKKIAAKAAMPPAVLRTIAPIAIANIPSTMRYSAPPITERATPACESEICRM